MIKMKGISKYIITITLFSLGVNCYFISKIILRKVNLYRYKDPKIEVSSSLTDPKTISYSMNRDKLYHALPIAEQGKVFMGDSHLQFFPLDDFFPNHHLVNRGIGGDVTLGILLRINEVLKYKPKKIFLEIGVNDLMQGLPYSQVIHNYDLIIKKIKEESPETSIYILSILPTGWYIYNSQIPVEAAILKVNQYLSQLSDSQVTYINCYDLMVDDIGTLDLKYDSGDRLHLNYEGYKVIANQVKKYL